MNFFINLNLNIGFLVLGNKDGFVTISKILRDKWNNTEIFYAIITFCYNICQIGYKVIYYRP